VAYGAAVQGAVLSGMGGDATKELLLIDVTPLSLGVETIGGKMSVLINRNTSIPTKQTEPFTTTEDNQTEILFKVFEGERPVTAGNNFLGEFSLTGIPRAKREVPKIDVTFSLDSNGILLVSAKDRATNKSSQITITNERGRLSKEDIERMMKESEQFKEQDEKERDRLDSIAELENLAYIMRQVTNTEDDMKDSDKKKLKQRSDDTLELIKNNRDLTPAQVKQQMGQLEKLLASMNITISNQNEQQDEYKIDDID
jgi:molecular chaperone DnaK (HSP70)